ncbi:hypothetical protein DW651_05770 [Subdoligranulum sp. AM23-21AC]|nr:hypothetical protein DW651_05770 [Subdoligranulum sp. AM23-21AC]
MCKLHILYKDTSSFIHIIQLKKQQTNKYVEKDVFIVDVGDSAMIIPDSEEISTLITGALEKSQLTLMKVYL